MVPTRKIEEEEKLLTCPGTLWEEWPLGESAQVEEGVGKNEFSVCTGVCVHTHAFPPSCAPTLCVTTMTTK